MSFRDADCASRLQLDFSVTVRFIVCVCCVQWGGVCCVCRVPRQHIQGLWSSLWLLRQWLWTARWLWTVWACSVQWVGEQRSWCRSRCCCRHAQRYTTQTPGQHVCMRLADIIIINIFNLQFIGSVIRGGSTTAKIIERWYYAPSHHLLTWCWVISTFKLFLWFLIRCH